VIMISHYFERRLPIRVMHHPIDHGVGRSIVEATDWHARIIDTISRAHRSSRPSVGLPFTRTTCLSRGHTAGFAHLDPRDADI
jgi:hypothetical protein